MYSGRIDRVGFFAGSAFLLLPLLLPLALYYTFIGMVGTNGADASIADSVTKLVLFFVWAVWLLLLPIYFGLMIRRLHDIGMSGWLSLLHLVPFTNIVLYVMLLLVPGSAGSNHYGPPATEKDPQRILFGESSGHNKRKVRYGKP